MSWRRDEDPKGDLFLRSIEKTAGVLVLASGLKLGVTVVRAGSDYIEARLLTGEDDPFIVPAASIVYYRVISATPRSGGSG